MLLYKYWFMVDVTKIRNSESKLTESQEVVFYACDLHDAMRQFEDEYGYGAPAQLRRENW